MSRLIIRERMLRSITKRKSEVVLRADFEKMADSLCGRENRSDSDAGNLQHRQPPDQS
ncbi:hypothetical protein [Desulfurivibrio dismutans]|uniref:hypothetical protein n=1 Tax=Desulfurivibrio dismutans TaxID=1398908 RepID=UPI0023DC60CD|nr:hypothetical protein [Desulfurivibrio alkaliphilus]MDF1615244.1 hypothetical protein [Desulfurivibrio alkaliphilus]